MPTKKPAKKRAPRTDWKARALHCEEVIGVQNQIAQGREKALSHEIARAESAQSAATSWENRATSAEKHNAILLAEREVWAKTPRHCEICADNVPPSCDSRCELIGRRQRRLDNCVTKEKDTYFGDIVADSLKYYWKLSDDQVARTASSTLYQRLKSRAAKWSIEIACALAVLAVFALASWYALRWGK
jgi:hypothetical protein